MKQSPEIAISITNAISTNDLAPLAVVGGVLVADDAATATALLLAATAAALGEVTAFVDVFADARARDLNVLKF